MVSDGLATGITRSTFVLICLTALGVGSAAKAGSIFDDDYLPPTAQTAPPPTPADQPASTTAPSSGTPAPTENAPAQSPAVVSDTNSNLPTQPLLTVPAPTDQAQSRKLFKEAFAADLKDHSPAARRALAAKLLAEADKVADNASDRFVLLVGACDAASEGGDLDLAQSTAAATATLFKVDATQLAANAVLKMQLKSLPPSEASETVDGGLKLENAVARGGDYSTAARILSALRPLAARDPEMGPLIKERARLLDEMRNAHDRAEVAVERLKKFPDDPAANTLLGEYLCFDRGNFSAGLKFLKISDDAALRSAATGDLRGATDSKRAIAIGDEWWNLAERKAARDHFKAAMRSRAAFWYANALEGGQITGLSREILEKRLTEGSDGPRFVYLSAMKETKVDGIVMDGLWGLTKNRMNKGGVPISVNGVTYEHGLGFNPGSGTTIHIDYALDGRYRRFSGAAGINDSAGSFDATITFKILGDGKELWHSHPFREAKVVDKFNVRVFNCKSLELQVVCDGTQQGAHCVWIEPRLETR